MLQLCYASRRIENGNDLLQDLSDILSKARQFNQQQQIVGVLYYAEGYFFQCLEGEAAAVEQIFARIAVDPRHDQVFRFSDHEVTEAHFSEWSMKYVHKHSEISSLFKRNGFTQFMPHQLNDEQLQEFLKILFRVEENHDNLASAKSGYKQRGYIPYL